MPQIGWCRVICPLPCYLVHRRIKLANKNFGDGGGDTDDCGSANVRKGSLHHARIAVSARLPLDSEEVRRCYKVVAESRGHALMAAERAGRVIALCHVYARPA